MQTIVLLQSFAKLFIIIAIGFVAVKKQVISLKLRYELSKLLVGITLPALIFTSAATNITWDLLSRLWFLPLLALGLGLLAYSVAKMMARWLGLEDDRAFVMIATFTNTLFLPIPLTVDVYGYEVLPAILIYDFGHAILLWGFGPNFLFSRDRSLQIKGLINPNAVALLLGTLVGCTGLSLPQVINGSLSMLAGATIPLAVLIIGMSLAGMKVSARTLADRQLWLSLGVRMALIPALVFIIIKLVPLPRLSQLGLAIEAPMPPLMSLSVLAERYGMDSHFASVGVVVGTIIALFSVPVYLVLVGAV